MAKPIHVIAHCVDCGIVFDNYKTAKASAKKHSKDENHKVTGEEAYRFVFRKGILK
jgi:hypothetical protein